MSWHSYNMNLASFQGQIQEAFMVASNRMASNANNISEYVEQYPLFEGLEAFTSDQILHFLRQGGPADTSSLNPGNAPSTLDLPMVVGENNPGNLQTFNGGSNHLNNSGLSETTPSESSLLCPWPTCQHRKPFSTKASLKRHYNSIHVAPRSFPCDKCHSTFNRKDNLRQHLRSVHRE